MKTKEKPKIRLLVFTPSLECGGSEKFVSLLCNNINTELFSVCLVVINNSSPFYEINNPAIEIIDFKMGRVLFSLARIKVVIKNYKPDIIFTTANHLNLYLAIFRRLFPKTIKFAARESSIVSLNTNRTRFPRLYNWLIKKYYRRFDIIICQSDYMQQDLIISYNIPVGKTAVIHNAIAEGQKNKNAATEKSAGKVYKFVTVARLSEEKAVERLIHAVSLLSVPYLFYIIGKGNKRGYLQHLINDLQLQEKIFLQGEKKEPFNGMEDADLFLMGSYYEGFPNVLLEAGSLGIPVIAFNAPGGIREIITDGENGLLVADNDLRAFAAAINKGITSGFDRNKIAASTQTRFSIGATMKKLEDLLVQL